MKNILLITFLSVLFINCSTEEDTTNTEPEIETATETDTDTETETEPDPEPEPSTLTNSALIHYPFDGNVDDITPNEYHGTNYGATFTSDRFDNMNGAVLFDGTDDYIDLPNLIELKPMAPISFSFWIRYDSPDTENRSVFNTSFEEGTNSGVYFNSQSSTGNYAINFGDGSNSYTSGSRRTYVANKSIEVNVWNHIVVMVNSELDMEIYVNSIKTDGTFSGTGNELQYSDTSGTLGRHFRSFNDPVNYFKGALDDFRYWNRALTENEILELHNPQ